MSILRDIQARAVDSNHSVADLLRLCKVLSYRLGNAEFKVWVDRELAGYGIEEDLPDYRRLRVASKGHFSGPWGSGARNAPIPTSVIPEPFRDLVTKHQLREPVGALQDLLSRGSDGSFQAPWPADATAHVGLGIYANMNCIEAWQVIPRGAIVGALDAVRDRVLNFVLEIEDIAPAAGDDRAENLIPAERVGNIFHTHIHGNVGSLSPGTSQVLENVSIAASDAPVRIVALDQWTGGAQTVGHNVSQDFSIDPTALVQADKFRAEVQSVLGALLDAREMLDPAERALLTRGFERVADLQVGGEPLSRVVEMVEEVWAKETAQEFKTALQRLSGTKILESILSGALLRAVVELVGSAV